MRFHENFWTATLFRLFVLGSKLPPRFIILWSSPGQLSVTRRLGPGKESTFVSEPGHPVVLSALNFKAGPISNCQQSKAPSPRDIFDTTEGHPHTLRHSLVEVNQAIK